MLYRLFSLNEGEARAKADDDFVREVAFSSELPYERWWGVEVLDHGESSIRMQRLNDGAPLLFNHDWDDQRGVHMPGTVRIDQDRVLRGKVRIAPVDDITRATISRIEKGILTKASIGYQIHKVIEQSTGKDGAKKERVLDGRLFERCVRSFSEGNEQHDLVKFRRSLDAAAGPFERAEDEPTIYRVVDWEPYENSLVTVPADNGVGVGRMAAEVSITGVNAAHRETRMEQQTGAAAVTAENSGAAAVAAAQDKLNEKSTLHMEQDRIRGLQNLAKANKVSDQVLQAWITRSYTVTDATEDLLRILEERGKLNPQPASMLGMSQTEVREFSILRAVQAIADGGKWDKAPYEAEVCKEVAKKLGRVAEPNKFCVPYDVLARKQFSASQIIAQRMAMGLPLHQRDLLATSAAAGGYLVATDNVGFIEMLRNRSVAFSMGVRRLSGLQGNVTIPRQTAAATAVWLATEGVSTIAESQQTFGQVALSPKNVGAYTELSRQLLLQSSPGAEGIVTDDLAQVVALAADLAVIAGSGAAGQPTGIKNTAGIGSVAAGAASYAKALEFQTDVASSNVRPAAGGYVTNAAQAAIWMQKQRFTSTDTPLWEGNIWEGNMVGFRAMSSEQMSAGDVLFGDWQEAVVGEWGVLEIEVNPFANFPAGIIGIRAIYTMDVGVRRPFAFSLGTGITA